MQKGPDIPGGKAMSLDQALDSILTDDLETAHALLSELAEPGSPFLSTLIVKALGNAPPLVTLTDRTPAQVAIHPSYTCDVRCQMCNSGFQNRSYLYENYKYFLPEQFEQFKPWVDRATHVYFVGMGETLDSPHINTFLEKVADKDSVVTTSGVPLTDEMVRELIHRGLKKLNFSFDGETSVGHGGGRETYIRHIWEKIRMVQEVKREMESAWPVLGLHITVNRENLLTLDRLLDEARNQGIRDILMLPMSVTNGSGQVNESLFEKSFANDFDSAKQRLNEIIEYGNRRGMRIHVHETPTLEDALPVCPYVDNVMQIHGQRDRPTVCCGPILMPLAFNDYPPEKYWNSFPYRYFRYLHFVAEEKALPQNCKECWVMNPKQYSETCRDFLDKPADEESRFFALYQKASKLKAEGLFHEARDAFRQLLEAGVWGELKGKVFYHLGEMEIMKNDFPRALEYMERSVQYYFDHRKAFACLYLLMAILGAPSVSSRRPKYFMDVPDNVNLAAEEQKKFSLNS
jgi:MoaA/NifB/PqqE/SkfB family radical SAM enzyme